MDTLVLHAHVSKDGHVTVLLPAAFANQAVEIVVRRASKLSSSEWSIGAVESPEDGAVQADGEYETQDGVE